MYGEAASSPSPRIYTETTDINGLNPRRSAASALIRGEINDPISYALI